MPIQLFADSGSTKCEWRIIENGVSKSIITAGISPYFLTEQQIIELLLFSLMPHLGPVTDDRRPTTDEPISLNTEKNSQTGQKEIDNIFFYGTGLSNKANAAIIKKVLRNLFPSATIEINTDLLAAARALCGHKKGMACILGTGSNSCYYNGKKISKNISSLGYILGDEGSGAHLGKKVLQYYLLETFDEDLQSRFDAQFVTTHLEVMESVYKKPFPNRYLASFTTFLSDNRGHYMIENILEDALNDFFFYNLCKYSETWTMPINFIGGVAHHFQDVLQELCNSYELELGIVLQNPMDGLVRYHSNQC